MLYEYSKQFLGEEAVKRYERKFEKRVDKIRHKAETNILRDHVRGDCFDCSIGTGRFINEMVNARTYAGIDYSADCVRYIQEVFPNVEVKEGDLLEGIEEPAGKYDTALCIRTLFALGNVDRIVKEMARITKKGGLVIFDYGTRPRAIELDDNRLVTTSDFNIEEVVRESGLEKEAVYDLDSLFVITIKKRRLLRRYFNSRKNIIPDCFYLFIERLLSVFWADRRLYVLRK